LLKAPLDLSGTDEYEIQLEELPAAIFAPPPILSLQGLLDVFAPAPVPVPLIGLPPNLIAPFSSFLCPCLTFSVVCSQ
jgi:hypothetical protein